MFIKELQLIKFGKFSDKIIELKDGLNVFCGANESGKSTIQLFIRAMFYGLPPARGKAAALRERAVPWGSDRAAGRLSLSADGRNYEIYREFGRRGADDVTRIIDSDTGEKCEDADFFGMSESMFERTLWIGQEDVCIRGRDEEISSRLVNMLRTGSSVSPEAAMNRLEKRELALKSRTRRNAAGEIDILTERRDRLSVELKRVEEEAAERRGYAEELKEIERRADEIDGVMTELSDTCIAEEKIRRMERLDSCLQREMQIANTRMFQVFKHRNCVAADEKLTQYRSTLDTLEVRAYDMNERLSSARQLLEKKEALEKRRRFIDMVPTAAAGAAAVVLLVIGIDIAGAACGAAAVIFAALYALLRVKAVKTAAAQLAECEKQGEELRVLRDGISEAENGIDVLLQKFECAEYEEFKEKLGIYKADAEKIRICRELYNEELGDDDYNELRSEAERLKNTIKHGFKTGLEGNNVQRGSETRELAEERTRISDRAAELRQRLDKPMPSAVDIQTELDAADEELKAKHTELKAVMLAEECLRESYARIRSDYTPSLNAETLRLTNRLTGNRHGNIKVADDFSIGLNSRGDSGELRRAEIFSTGTYNQLYFALRLAVIRLTVPKEKRIMFIDDLFVTFDDERGRRAIGLLSDICTEDDTQALLFTCHGRDSEYAKKTGAALNLI